MPPAATKTIDVATIGFTRTSAAHFFARLKQAHVKRVIDVRLNTTSQLSGFAKSEDLKFFLKEVGGIDYRHEPLLAPTPEMLKTYRADKKSWQRYAQEFLALMAAREIEKRIAPDLLHHACLLCSEAEPHHCHRTLVCEYLARTWSNTKVTHL